MTEPLSSGQIRDAFLSFFKEKEHEVVPSASLVPLGDPTLLFTNAGMNQFKDVFLEEGSRPYVRAVDTQKCLRVSGKHNDLEEVGHDTYHHTFFEMLGNWSFGDYFKKEAIRWAWELLTGRWGLAPDRLYATVHEGDEALGLAPDDEAAALWQSETALEKDHILFYGSKDNFWMMGDTGPCGPCSEVHVDLREDDERARVPGRDLVNKDDPRVMEIWNLVFIQYNARNDGTLEPLAAQHVDTGMGFERVVAILQGKQSNYDTDLFAPILQKIADLSPRDEIKGYDEIDADEEREKLRVAMRVVADHIRAIAFAIADGAVPGNVGRGYVIRRILRRAVRYGYQALGFREPFLYRLVAPLKDKMGRTFPELGRHQERIERNIRAEEESFINTLGTGISLFQKYLNMQHKFAAQELNPNHTTALDAHLREYGTLLGMAYPGEVLSKMIDDFYASARNGTLSGNVAFLLHDTYGFPIDLTQLMAREEGLGVDMARYDELMARQKERARAASGFKGDHGSIVSLSASPGALPSGFKGDHGSATLEAGEWRTVSQGEDSFFDGYDRTAIEKAAIRKLRRIPVDDDDERVEVVLNRTPFYAESGGQVGDTGFLRVGDEVLEVLDTQKEDGRILHVVDRLPIAPEARVEAVVDAARRARIQKHHTVTHLMHAALREVLGGHVAQKGSLVAPDYLRFDFSHFERVTPDVLRRIEQRVNDVIQRNFTRQEERNVPVEEALARGATALFGEKYGDRVRVITFGSDYSVELCGGTHVGATGEIGVFRFRSEGSIAAGIRRVEAVAGRDALAFIDREIGELERVRGQFRALQRPTDEEIADLIEQNKHLEKELEQARRQQLAAGLDALIDQAREVGPARLVSGRIADTDMDTLRALGQTLRDRLGSGAVGVLGTVDPEGEKVYLVATVSDDLVQERNLQAGALVGQLARRVGGGGGGRPTLATAGGRQPEHLDATLAAAAEMLGDLLA